MYHESMNRVTVDPKKAPNWMLEGSCRNTDPNFFPDKGEDTQPARRLCRGCPVLTECLDYAIAWDMDGIWGGTTHKERMRRYSKTAREMVKDDYFG